MCLVIRHVASANMDECARHDQKSLMHPQYLHLRTKRGLWTSMLCDGVIIQRSVAFPWRKIKTFWGETTMLTSSPRRLPRLVLPRT